MKNHVLTIDNFNCLTSEFSKMNYVSLIISYIIISTIFPRNITKIPNYLTSESSKTNFTLLLITLPY